MKRFLFSLLALCLLTSVSNAQSAGSVVINEFVASNDSLGGYQEPDGGFGDWVEFYNNGNSTVNLEGVNFSDDLLELDKWAFPAGVTIAGGGYLILWVDNDTLQTGIHAYFKLSKAGEDVVLSQNGTIIDQYTYGAQQTNIAEARVPNGTGSFVKQTPTPNANNQSSGTREPATFSLTAYPNPTTNVLNVALGNVRFDRYEVVSPTGAIVMKGVLTNSSDQLLLYVAQLAAGQYQVIFDEGKAAARFTRF